MVQHRYFFALKPPAHQVRGIGAVRDGLPGDALVVDSRLHLTLAPTPLFDAEQPTVVEALRKLGGAVDAEPEPVLLDRLSAQGGSVALRPARPLRGVVAMASQLIRMMSRQALLLENYSCRPHLSLFYRFGQTFVRPIPPISWEARDIVLIHSLHGLTRHEELGRWSLATRQYRLSFE